MIHQVHCSSILTMPNVGAYDYSGSCSCGWDFGRMTRFAGTLVAEIAAHTDGPLDLSCPCTKEIPGLRERLG